MNKLNDHPPQRAASTTLKHSLVVFILSLILLTTTAPQMGLTWDEPFYIAASESYMNWFGKFFLSPQLALQPSTIVKYWDITHEHPPLDKVWSGTVWLFTRKIFADLTAHRLGNMILSSVLLACVYFWTRQAFGQRAGIFAWLALVTMPRFFFHMHLAALDVPVSALIYLNTYFLWHSAEETKNFTSPPGVKIRPDILLVYLLFSLSMITKINAIFIPVIFAIWIILFYRTLPAFVRIALMGLIAIPVYFLSSPWYYDKTLKRVAELINFVFHGHPTHGQWYFGQYYFPPPWHFPFVMIFSVVPLSVFLLSAVGACAEWNKRKSLLALILLSIFIPLLIFASSLSAVYDNERLFMQVFPFIAMLAGSGFSYLIEKLLRLKSMKPALVGRLENTTMTFLVATILILPQVFNVIPLYPHLLSYYSEGIGGLRGAHKLGLETTYWCETYVEAIPYLNQHAKKGDVIWVDPWSWIVLVYYQDHGYLRKDLGFTLSNYRGAAWVLFQHRESIYGREGLQSNLAIFLKNKSPDLRLQVQGIELMDLYSH